MPIMIFTEGESRRSPEAEKDRQQKSKQKAFSKRGKSQRPQNDVWTPKVAESSGSAAVAAEPGPAWDAWEPGPAAFAPEAGLDHQWLPANLPIGTANFVQPRETGLPRIDNAIEQYNARMAAIRGAWAGTLLGEYSPGKAMQYESRQRHQWFEDVVRMYGLEDIQPQRSFDTI